MAGGAVDEGLSAELKKATRKGRFFLCRRNRLRQDVAPETDGNRLPFKVNLNLVEQGSNTQAVDLRTTMFHFENPCSRALTA